MCTDQNVQCRFAQLQQADVSHVEPAVRADINIATVLRDDVPVEYDNRYRYIHHMLQFWYICIHEARTPQPSKHDILSPQFCCREALLAEVPEREGAFVKVPKIM